MTGSIGSSFQVSQTYTRHVEKVDTKHAQSSGGRNLAAAPNQNIRSDTRGAFKSNVSFFKQSLSGFVDAPAAKKIAFLKDRIALRSLQKQEIAGFKRLAREDRLEAGRNFRPPSLTNLEAPDILHVSTPKTKAELSLSLLGWHDHAVAQSKRNGTTLSQEYAKVGEQLATNLDIENWKNLDLPALKDTMNRYRAEGRTDQANLLGSVIGKLSTVVNQDNAVARFHDRARNYIENFKLDTVEFWRNNNVGGELELKACISHGFMNPFKNQAVSQFHASIQGMPQKNILSGASATMKNLNEQQAVATRELAMKLFDVLSNMELSETMLEPLARIRDDIAELRTDDKAAITRKFFLNAIMLKSITPETSDRPSDSRAMLLAATMLYEVLIDRTPGLDTPAGLETFELAHAIGDRGETMLKRFGLPDYATKRGVGEEEDRNDVGRERNIPVDNFVPRPLPPIRNLNQDGNINQPPPGNVGNNQNQAGQQETPWIEQLD